MPEQTIKIEGARFIITLDPQRRIISNGSILIRGPRIVRVGKAEELAGEPADRVIPARDMVVTPGFTNGHMHISYAHAVRGIFPDDLQAWDYLAYVFLLQSAMTEEEYYTSLLAVTELLKGGTTCFLDPGSTKYLDACMDVYDRSGCRIITGRQVTDQPNPLHLPVYTTEEALRLTREAIRKYDGRLGGRVRAWAMPFSSQYCSADLLRGVKRLADDLGTWVTIHQSNTHAQVQSFLQRYGKRPVQYLEEIGALGPNVLLSHIVGLDEAEVECMARTGTKGTMCPTAAVKMGWGITSRGKLPEMLEKGVCVGLATDAGNNSNLLETLRSVYLTAVLFKDGRQDPGVLPAERALEMGTLLGARSLGLDGEIGSIEPGKRADLVLFDTRRPEWRALFNPVNNLVYNADGRSVHTVLVDGRVVVENHRPTFVDEDTLVDRVQELGERLLKRTGVSFTPRWPVV